MAVALSDSAGSALAVAGLPVAFGVAFAYVMLKPRNRGRTRLRTAFRFLLSKRIWMHPSTLLDVQYIIGAFGFSLLFGYCLIAGYAIISGVSEGLTQLFGPRAVPTELPYFVILLCGFGLHLAFEFAYWLDHFLSHKIVFLWEFHKVHHSAAVLTPFVNWRVHPVDTIVYINILTVIVGSATGVIEYFAGEEFAWACMGVSGTMYAIYMAVWGHLQHSQLWIPCTGLAGRLVMSPAHHQIHHSSDPIHFDKNFGAGFAIWDWLFGTLHIPKRKKEQLRFGTKGDSHLKQFIPSVLYPFHRAAKRLTARFQKRNRRPERQPDTNTEPLTSTSQTPVGTGVDRR
ncbi:MAG: sterol desaturase family protein [Planctomycetes bacterium]|nr:sterol desaturase family protein [Planctomycetota bacterium]